MIAVNLCIFNHPMAGITDQAFFVETLLRNRGYDVSISDRLRKDALNLVIENFRLASDGFNFVESMEKFCGRFGKRVGIIMTEHIERHEAQILFNGALLTDAVYIANKMSRLFSVLAHSKFAHCFFTLGPLPELNSFRQIFLLHSLYRLPFPDLGTSMPAGDLPYADEIGYDAVFTGSMTPYRKQVLEELRSRFKILVSTEFQTEVRREALYRGAKVALNIPQDASWGWISPMRVIFGLRVGRPTVHFGGTLRQTEFDRAVPLEEDLSTAIADPAALYKNQATGYDQLVRKGANQFPDHIFRLWAMLEDLDDFGTGGDVQPAYRRSDAAF